MCRKPISSHRLGTSRETGPVNWAKCRYLCVNYQCTTMQKLFIKPIIIQIRTGSLRLTGLNVVNMHNNVSAQSGFSLPNFNFQAENGQKQVMITTWSNDKWTSNIYTNVLCLQAFTWLTVIIPQRDRLNTNMFIHSCSAEMTSTTNTRAT